MKTMKAAEFQKIIYTGTRLNERRQQGAPLQRFREEGHPRGGGGRAPWWADYNIWGVTVTGKKILLARERLYFYGTDDLIRYHEEAGGKFFTRGAMSLFKSRILWGTYGGRFFVTSERMGESSPREYRVRQINKDGTINTVNAIFATAGQALAEAKRLGREEGWRPPQRLVSLYY